MRVDWKGVYPAVTTQLHANLVVDIVIVFFDPRARAREAA